MGDASLFHQSVSISGKGEHSEKKTTNPQKSQEQINYINGDVAKKTQVSRSLSNSRLSVGSPHPTGVQNIFSTVHPNG